MGGRVPLGLRRLLPLALLALCHPVTGNSSLPAPLGCLRTECMGFGNLLGCHEYSKIQIGGLLAHGRRKFVYEVGVEGRDGRYALKTTKAIGRERTGPMQPGGKVEVLKEIRIMKSLHVHSFVQPIAGYCKKKSNPWILYPLANKGNAWMVTKRKGDRFTERAFVNNITNHEWIKMSYYLLRSWACMEEVGADKYAYLQDTGPKQVVVDKVWVSFITDVDGLVIVPKSKKVEDHRICRHNSTCRKVHPGELTPDHYCFGAQPEPGDLGHCRGVDTKTAVYQLSGMFLSAVPVPEIAELKERGLHPDPDQRPSAREMLASVSRIAEAEGVKIDPLAGVC